MDMPPLLVAFPPRRDSASSRAEATGSASPAVEGRASVRIGRTDATTSWRARCRHRFQAVAATRLETGAEGGGRSSGPRGVHKLGRVPNPVDLQEDSRPW